MKVFSTLEPATRRNLLLLFAVGLLFWASLAALLPTLPLYIRDVGGTKSQIGVVMGAFAVGLLLFRPWLGQLADRRGRQVVLLIGLVAAAIAPLGYLVTQSMPLLIAVRAFHGLSIAAFTTAYSTLVVDLSPPSNRGEVIGYMSLVNPVGVAIGPAIGGFLQEWAGYTPLFLLSTGLGVVGFVGALWIQAPVPVAQPIASTSKTTLWRLLWSPRLRTPTLTLMLAGMAFGVLSTFVPLFIQEAGVNLNAGLFYTAAAVASFSVRLLTGRASDRHGRGRFITLGLLLYAVTMLLLWSARSTDVFLLAGLLEGAGIGIFLPLMIALVADRSEAHERGRVFSLCVGGFDLGIAIAGPTLGLFAEQIGYRGLFGLSSGLVFLSVIVFVTQSSKTLSQSLRFAFGEGRDFYALPHGK
ncbi:MFS transporter [Phormidium sp. FACHB-592]|uniref:MFS transporter n=1 Tax=Stenomitos frigidus AS-A4 TaxID=2933935 RepID=A0ABV0KQ81_9CYAN|nr:MFS transporter [Phormidium sp. FACHB-592]MBD2073464.1 MFS transporter [Phormidium sp. FACHB-592]